ncbi:MAG: hypothetical protein J6B12_03625 [Clostridia bacterium]|nr:hypothetical protein [Clostridia bacterium]
MMKKTTLRILMAVLALLLVVAAFSACGKKVSKKPEDAILNALEVTEKLSAKSELATTMEQYTGFNSLEYNIDLGGLISSVFSSAMGGMEVSLTSKLDLNLKTISAEDAAYASIAVLLNDTDLLRLDAIANTKELALACEALLEDTAYGVSYDKFLDWYEEMSGASLEESGIYLNEIMESNAKSIELMQKLGGIIDKYKETFVKALFENADTVRTEETVTVNGVSAEAVVFTATVNESDAIKVIETLYNTYKNDTETRDTIQELAKLYGSTDEDITAIYKDIEEFIAEPVTDEEPVKLRFVIDKSKGNLISTSILDVDDDELLELTLGIDPENPSYFALKIEDAFTFIYRVSENTETAYAAELTLKVEGEKIVFPISYDKTTNVYTTSFSIDGDNITVSGIAKAEQDALIFSVDDITMKIDGETVSVKLGLTATISKSEEPVPAMPEYTDFTTLSDEDLVKLEEELGVKLGELMTMLPSDLQFLLGSLMGA